MERPVNGPEPGASPSLLGALDRSLLELLPSAPSIPATAGAEVSTPPHFGAHCLVTTADSVFNDENFSIKGI